VAPRRGAPGSRAYLPARVGGDERAVDPWGLRARWSGEPVEQAVLEMARQELPAAPPAPPQALVPEGLSIALSRRGRAAGVDAPVGPSPTALAGALAAHGAPSGEALAALGERFAPYPDFAEAAALQLEALQALPVARVEASAAPVMRREAGGPERWDPAAVLARLRGSRGASIDPALATRMGAALGHDVRHARIHVGAEAAASCEALRARAFTIPDTERCALALELVPEIPSLIRLALDELLYDAEGDPIYEPLDWIRGELAASLVGDVEDTADTEVFNLDRTLALVEDRQAYLYDGSYLGHVGAALVKRQVLTPTTTPDWVGALQNLDQDLWNPGTVVEASDLDRYVLYLEVLKGEAAAYDFSGKPDTFSFANLGRGLFHHLLAQDVGYLGEPATREHSHAFLAHWMSQIEQVVYVEDFDPALYAPSEADTTALKEEIDLILDDFVTDSAPRMVTLYVLNTFIGSRSQSPTDFLASLDFSSMRGALIDTLVTIAMSDIARDEAFQELARDATYEQAVFGVLTAVYGLAVSAPDGHVALHDFFWENPLDEADAWELSVADDPYAYYQQEAAVAAACQAFFTRVAGGHDVEVAFADLAASWGAARFVGDPEATRKYSVLPRLMLQAEAIKEIKEDAQERARARIQHAVDTSYEKITAIVLSHVQIAEQWLRDKWEPKIREIALRNLDKSVGELQQWYDNWETATPAVAAQYESASAAFKKMADDAESGDAERMKTDGRLLKRSDAPALRDAAKLLAEAAAVLRDPEKREEEKEELGDALEKVKEVQSDIQTGELEPKDFGMKIQDQARAELGLGEYPEYTRWQDVLLNDISPTHSPFLTRATYVWNWNEIRVPEMDRQMLMIGLGLITVGAIVVPGVGGLILGALDIGASLYMAGRAIEDASELLRWARLQSGPGRELSIAQAEKALKNAWISMALTAVLTAGIGALYARSVFIKGGRAVAGDIRHFDDLLMRDPGMAEALAKRFQGDLRKLDSMLGGLSAMGRDGAHRLFLLADEAGGVANLERLVGSFGDIAQVERLSHIAGGAGQLRSLAEVFGDAKAVGAMLDAAGDYGTLQRLIDQAGGHASLSHLVERAGGAAPFRALMSELDDALLLLTDIGGAELQAMVRTYSPGAINALTPALKGQGLLSLSKLDFFNFAPAMKAHLEARGPPPSASRPSRVARSPRSIRSSPAPASPAPTPAAAWSSGPTPTTRPSASRSARRPSPTPSGGWRAWSRRSRRSPGTAPRRRSSRRSPTAAPSCPPGPTSRRTSSRTGSRSRRGASRPWMS